MKCQCLSSFYPLVLDSLIIDQKCNYGYSGNRYSRYGSLCSTI